MGLSRSFALPVAPKAFGGAVTPPAFDPCSIRGSEELFIRSSASEFNAVGPFPLKRRLLSAEAKKIPLCLRDDRRYFPVHANSKALCTLPLHQRAAGGRRRPGDPSHSSEGEHGD